ncbi:hypothetical protein OJ997_28675 [Solirubrobacter phytolaccae]|uniref:Gasdermin bGSDM n=1 Tax=Solirubrobacter phytolaccae TaxID=1404360 RepID=A0A9X3NFI3_9ACTN|nr:hypothetical protein [Solirubrobacter phytolaccae]MDA0184314.1 hypothetical protein [Solirubrobacter phytolaccae]
MPRLPLCSGDPLVHTLRDLFDAVPLRTPEERVTTMSVVASQDGRSRFLGPLGPILDGDEALDVDAIESRIASLAGKRSRVVERKLALEILEGFLAPLGVPLPAVAAAVGRSTKVSFRFDDVRRRYVEVTRVGKLLRDRRIDTANATATMFLEQRADFLLVDSVLQSSGFAIEVDDERSRSAEFDAGAISELIGTVQPSTTTVTADQRQITFAGTRPLTFAFSCVRFFVDEYGALASIEPDRGPASLGFGPSGVVIETPNRVLLTQEPALLEWDDDGL